MVSEPDGADASTALSAVTNGRRTNAAGRPPTLRDVAALAAVNPSVVSRVLNRDPTLKIDRRHPRRVLDAVTQLSYRPNALARGLRMSTTSAIGLVLPEVANPVYGPIVVGAERRASEAGYVLVLGGGLDAASTEASFARLLDEGPGGRAAGRVRHGRGRAAADVSRQVRRRSSRSTAGSAAPSARSSSTTPRRLAWPRSTSSSWAISRIMHIAGPPSMDTTQRRQQGYEAAMTAAGLPSMVVAGRGLGCGLRIPRGPARLGGPARQRGLRRQRHVRHRRHPRGPRAWPPGAR